MFSYNPVPKPVHTRLKPKRGKATQFSKTVRQAIIKRDKGLCVRCKQRYHNIHHCIFASAGGRGEISNGVCVCYYCHEWAHSGREGREWFMKYREINLLPQAVESTESARAE